MLTQDQIDDWDERDWPQFDGKPVDPAQCYRLNGQWARDEFEHGERSPVYADVSPKPAATLTIKIDTKEAIAQLRCSAADQIVEWIVSMGLAWPIVLRILEKDATSRAMLATEIGEEGIKVQAAEAKREDDDSLAEESWDSIASRVLAEQLDTPGGRAEVCGR